MKNNRPVPTTKAECLDRHISDLIKLGADGMFYHKRSNDKQLDPYTRRLAGLTCEDLQKRRGVIISDIDRVGESIRVEEDNG